VGGVEAEWAESGAEVVGGAGSKAKGTSELVNSDWLRLCVFLSVVPRF